MLPGFAAGSLAKKERKRMSEERNYIAVSIKHTHRGWKCGDALVMWGYHRTEDDEPRCFARYTEDPRKAELYALGDFTEHGYNKDFASIKDDAPVGEIGYKFCKKLEEWDTVLVSEEEVMAYYRVFDLLPEAQWKAMMRRKGMM